MQPNPPRKSRQRNTSQPTGGRSLEWTRTILAFTLGVTATAGVGYWLIQRVSVPLPASLPTVVSKPDGQETTREPVLPSATHLEPLPEQARNGQESVTAHQTCAITEGNDSLPLVDPKSRSFAGWLDTFQRQAIACGVDPDTAAVALRSVRYDEKIARLDRSQPEYNSTFDDYLRRRISKDMIDRGRSHLQRHGPLLAQLSKHYGVPPEVIVALWGLESGYGNDIGNIPTMTALATLAYEGRRSDFYQRELLAALRILEAGETSLAGLRGSWAGAMGLVQFMPSVFLDHAVDANGDGRRDIWTSAPDALASAANYLQRIGWRPNQRWGLEVRLPDHFDLYQAELNVRLPMADLVAAGIRPASGRDWPYQLQDQPKTGAIVLPAGANGPAFLVFDNFDVILEWNRSIFYALTVGQLAQRLSGGPALVINQPPGERPLRRTEVIGLQEDLQRLGFEVGEADGMVGAQTRQALRDFQRQHGLQADAYPTPILIARIHAESAGKQQGSARPN